MFLVKNIAGELLSPLSISLLVLAIALVVLWFTPRQRLGKLLATAGLLLLASVGYGWLGGPAVRALEADFPPMTAPPAGIKWVVVLGGGAWSKPDLPIIWRANPLTLARAVEGVRLHRRLPGAKLVVSGGAVYGSGGEAETMAALAEELGVPRDQIILDAASPDTESQARAMRALLKDEPCILVTSALHMRRALTLFRKAGVNAVPAPTDYMSQTNQGLRPSSFFPDARRIGLANAAAHEYLGLAWAWMTGRL